MGEAKDAHEIEALPNVPEPTTNVSYNLIIWKVRRRKSILNIMAVTCAVNFYEEAFVFSQYRTVLL